MSSPLPTREQVLTALAGVNDPEIGRPITELGMVKSVEIGADGLVAVGVYLTVAGCPMRDTITSRVTGAVAPLAGVTGVRVELDVMGEEQRKDLQATLRGGAPERVIPFAQPSSLTKVYAIVSGKGGVGKSSVTVNLAAALAAAGHKVALIDADIYGHSVPRMLGVTGVPTKVQDMIMPPAAKGVKVISAGMLKPPGQDALPIRGPILHRLLEQFLADFYWGDLDYLHRHAAGDRRRRAVARPARARRGACDRYHTAGGRRRGGQARGNAGHPDPPARRRRDREHVVPALPALRRGDGRLRIGWRREHRHGSYPAHRGGSAATRPGTAGRRLREGGDSGTPLVLADPSAPASVQLIKVAESLSSKGRGLAGRMLTLSPR